MYADGVFESLQLFNKFCNLLNMNKKLKLLIDMCVDFAMDPA